jgi:steroid delta-isomerase-like uncharacterized protein
MTTTSATHPSATPADLARRLFDCIGRHDLDEAAKLWRDDIVEDIVAVGVMRGKAETRRFFEETFGAFPDFTIEIETLVADDRVAFTGWRATGTFTGSKFQGIAANGKRIELRGVDRMEFEAGLLVRNTVYYDGMGFARSIGMLPEASSGAETLMKEAFNAFTAIRKNLPV